MAEEASASEMMTYVPIREESTELRLDQIGEWWDFPDDSTDDEESASDGGTESSVSKEGAKAEAITSQTTTEWATAEVPELPPQDSDAESTPARGIKAPEELVVLELVETP